MYIERERDLSEHIIIIDPEIHKKANLTREQFLEKVAFVKEIRTSINYNYISFYITTIEEYLNLKKFHELVNDAKFDFKHYHNFAIAIEKKLYEWFKNTDYHIIEKQITFWLATVYYFVTQNRHNLKRQLYLPLFEEVLKLINRFYDNFILEDYESINQISKRSKEEKLMYQEKCQKKYIENCQLFYNSNPPEFLESPFGYNVLNGWGINDRYCFEFIEAYFAQKDWEFIILKGGKDDMERAESRSDLWVKWKHTYATYDQRKNPIYSFYYPISTESKLSRKRESISQNVKNAVWKRDEGKCIQCGSKERLEFDHIIPVVKGGPSTYRNVQLLCETCNRKKSSKLV